MAIMSLGLAPLFAILALFGNVLCLPRDCEDVYELGFNTTSTYVIYPERTNGFRVRCDMDTGSGGWTVIQRRVSDSNFYRGWDEYEIGFGDLDTNFWLGLLQINAITTQSRWYTLRIDMTHANGTQAFAAYKVFAVGDTESKYRLLVNGYYGDAGDNLYYHNGYQFTTKDRDDDIYSSNCASRYIGAWWYAKCHISNLNGHYGDNSYARGLTWKSFTGYYSSLTSVEMKVKRSAPESDGVQVELSP